MPLKPNPKCPNYHHARRMLDLLKRAVDLDELKGEAYWTEWTDEAKAIIAEASELPDIRTLDERAALITQAVIDARRQL